MPLRQSLSSLSLHGQWPVVLTGTRACCSFVIVLARFLMSQSRHSENRASSPSRQMETVAGSAADDDELMLNVLRCHLTY